MFNVCQTVTIRLQVGFPRGKLRIGDTEQPLRNVIAQHEHPEATATGGKAFKAAGLGMDTSAEVHSAGARSERGSSSPPLLDRQGLRCGGPPGSSTGQSKGDRDA
jgi:hypothetical protein